MQHVSIVPSGGAVLSCYVSYTYILIGHRLRQRTLSLPPASRLWLVCGRDERAACDDRREARSASPQRSSNNERNERDHPPARTKVPTRVP